MRASTGLGLRSSYGIGDPNTTSLKPLPRMAPQPWKHQQHRLPYRSVISIPKSAGPDQLQKRLMIVTKASDAQGETNANRFKPARSVSELISGVQGSDDAQQPVSTLVAASLLVGFAIVAHVAFAYPPISATWLHLHAFQCAH